MGWLEIISLVLKFLLELWRSSQLTPEQAKLQAIANITKDMNNDVESFNKALAANDAVALSEHFAQLKLRALKASGGGTGRRADSGD